VGSQGPHRRSRPGSGSPVLTRTPADRSHPLAIQLTRLGLDVGLVTRDGERLLAFYRDVLGLPLAGEVAIPGTGRIRRLQVGESMLRIFEPETAPLAPAADTGFAARSGYRYCTLSVANLDEVVTACRVAGRRISVEIRELRPGMRVAMVEDPDGNTLELVGP
jgi:catechol 2,3-dioxygenase-like lactoylglutathione lyase family enzyme